MRLGRGVIAAGLAAVLLATSVVGVAADNPRGVTVMTQNIYQGTELEHVLAATTPQQFVQGVATDYANVISTNFPARADAMATEIARTRPTLVGLQEVANWQAQSPLPSYDFLQILIDALRAHGMQFAVVAVRDNFSAGGLGLFQSGLLNVQLTERTAIIARTDLPTSELSVTNPQAGAFQHVSVFHLLNGPFPLNAGWVSVDAKVRGKTIRFITTHLDGFNTLIAGAQAQELLAGPAATTLPVVISGDFNSEATDPAYTVVTGAGGIGDLHLPALLERFHPATGRPAGQFQIPDPGRPRHVAGGVQHRLRHADDRRRGRGDPHDAGLLRLPALLRRRHPHRRRKRLAPSRDPIAGRIGSR